MNKCIQLLKLALICTAALVLAPSAAAEVTDCVRAKNIEAIIDDSDSMSSSDTSRLRLQAMSLFAHRASNVKKTLGAVKFGTSATEILAPTLISSQAETIASALNSQILANAGSSDYNAAFNLAKSANPNAKAWILITGSVHNVGDYLNVHVGAPPVYVIGFGDAALGGSSTRLKQIADDSGGKYYALSDASTIQATVNKINAELDCRSSYQVTLVDTFNSITDIAGNSTKLIRSVKNGDIDITWGNPLDTFSLASVKIATGQGRAVATVAKTKWIKLAIASGPTFYTARVKNLRFKGGKKIKIFVKPSALSLAGTPVTVQVTQYIRD